MKKQVVNEVGGMTDASAGVSIPVRNMIRITRGSAEDAAEMLTLLLTSFAQYQGKLNPQQSVFRETIPSLRKRIAEGRLLLVRANDEMVGCLVCDRLSHVLYLGRLAVHPAYRKQGIVRQLILAAEEVAIEQGYRQTLCEVRIVLSDNVRLFQSLGYDITAAKAHDGFDEPTYYQLTKRLSGVGSQSQGARH